MPAGVFFCPFRLAVLASSPKGAPLVAVAKLLAKVQSFRQRQLRPLRRSRRESQVLKSIAKASGVTRKCMGMLLPLPLGEVDLRSKDGEGARR